MRALAAASVIAAVLAVGAPDNGLGEDYTWVAWDDATAMAAAVQKPIMVCIELSVLVYETPVGSVKEIFGTCHLF